VKIKQRTRERNVWVPTSKQRGRLALVASEAVLVEVTLRLLAPLLLRLSAATGVVTTGATRHLLVRLCHAGSAETSLVLGEGLSAGAWTCPSIRLRIAIFELPSVALTLG
jgi:hypothetical protein